MDLGVTRSKTGPFTQSTPGFLLWVLPVGAKLNSPSSNSSKQSKYKCPILLERSFENLSGRDITSPSTASVEGAHRLRSPTRGMTSTKSGKRWRCSVRRHRRLVMSTRVSWTCAEVHTSSHGDVIIFRYRNFCIRLSARVGPMVPE